LFAQTVIFRKSLFWFLGGGPQAAILRKSPFAYSRLSASPIYRRESTHGGIHPANTAAHYRQIVK
jgi:hypothetical protein